MFRRLALLLLLIPFLWSNWPSSTQPVTHASQATQRTPVPTFTPTPPISILPTPASPPPVLLDRQPSEYIPLTLHTPITVTFDRPLDPASVAQALTISPTLPVDLAWHGNQLSIHPRPAWQPDTTYHFTLTDSASDPASIQLATNYVWENFLPPVYYSDYYPTVVNPSQPLTFRFNYPLDVTNSLPQLHIEPAIVGEWAWDQASNILSLQPAEQLPAATHYTITVISDLRTLDGDLLPTPAAQKWTTPSAIQNTSPSIHQPTQPNVPVIISFDRPMDQASVEAAFTISPAVTGTFAWQANALHFVPSRGYFDENSNYEVTLDATARSQNGTAILSSPYRWSFSTSQLQRRVNWGDGSKVQVVDVVGRRAVQFQVANYGTENTQLLPLSTAEFKLYPLTLDQFIQRYTASVPDPMQWTRNPITTSDLQSLLSWRSDTDLTTNQPYRSARETILPAEIAPGLYILEISEGPTSDQLFLVLTRNSLMLKEAEGQIVAWVTDINGVSQADAEVTLYAPDGAPLAQGRSDAEGVYRSAKLSASPRIAVARTVSAQGEDLTLTSLDHDWRSHNNPWGWWGDAQTAQRFAVHTYTDRPIYRPGQTVYYKAILRHDDDALLSLPTVGMSVTTRIRDSRNNIVQTFPLTSNEFGTVNGAFQLAAEVMLGEYAVEVVVDNESHRQVFKVEEYRKPDYEVTVQTDAEEYIQGDPITLRLESRYFYGEPVANAQVTLRQFRLLPKDWWSPGAAPDSFQWSNTMGEEITGTTDIRGHFSVTIPANTHGDSYRPDWQSNLQQATVGLEVTVDDGSHQTVSSFAVAKVYNAAEKIEVDSGDYLKTVGTPFTPQVQIVAVDQQIVAAHILTATVKRMIWRDKAAEQVVYSATIPFDSAQSLSLPVIITQTGSYVLLFESVDRNGNPIRNQSWIYAIDENDSTWQLYDRHDKVKIRSERTTYTPGERARLLIESSVAGPALLTFERGTTRRQQLLQLRSGLNVVDVAVLPDDAPNIFVTVNLWEAQDTNLTENTWVNQPDSRLYQASLELHIPVTNKQLTIALSADQATYAPRDAATFTIDVRDEQGQPVIAELSLALVDEAIFRLSEELAGPIFDAFYGERDHLVRTYDSMSPMRWLGGGGGGGGGCCATANPRSNFPDTALWLPVVHTDAEGKATLNVTLPDNLTTWRLTAKAVSAEQTQVGENFLQIITQQPLVVQPLLPPHLTVGDRAEIAAIVHNYSEQAHDLSVSLILSSTTADPGVRLLGTIAKTIHLEAGQSQVVGWPVRASEAGDLQITISASAGQGDNAITDAVRLPFSIRPRAIPNVTNQIGQFGDQFTTTIPLPGDALSLSAITIDLSRSIAGEMLNGLAYLTGYPYGCVEQTMSRALPNAVVGRAFAQLGVSDPGLQADLPPLINAGVQRLYGFQHDDGGWGWWHDDNSDAYQTAWVIFGLAVTGQAGYEVDPQVIKRGVDWLQQHWSEMDPRTRAYALYSLSAASYSNLPATRDLLKEVDQLDPFSQAALALALDLQGLNDEATAIVDQLAASAVIEEGKVYWKTGEMDGHYQQKTMSSATRTTALILSAFVRIRPNHPLEASIVRWLMAQRRPEGWGSTNETSYALLGLTDHLLATEEASAETSYQIELNGALITQGDLAVGNSTRRLQIPVEQMQPGDNLLRISQTGAGQLYYTISSRIYRPQGTIEAAGKIGLTRSYLDAASGQPISNVIPGQLVKVRLQVAMPDSGFYMIVEDKLPAGFEALNEGLNTTSHVASLYGQEQTYYWQQYGYNNKEVRPDRVSFFITELPAGQRTFTYLARAIRHGRFVSMPAEAYAMYDVTLWGRSSAAEVVVEE